MLLRAFFSCAGLALIALDGSSAAPVEAAPAVATLGEGQVCYTGYVMDVLCIDLGVLKDMKHIVTLSAEGPPSHSFHCLVDVQSCIDSGFELLEQNDDSTYSRKYRLDIAGRDAAVDLARAEGSVEAGCTTCYGTGTSSSGFMVTAIGVPVP